MPAVLAGCARNYTVRSEPSDALVMINGEQRGRTPLTIPFNELPQSGLISVVVSKEQYDPAQVAVAAPVSGQMASTLQVGLTRRVEEDTIKINRQVGRLVRAQKLTMEKRYDEALRLVDEMTVETPRLVYAQVLKGSILFLSGNYPAASAQWRKVLEIEPSNSEALRMVQVTDDQGGGLPSAPGSSSGRKPSTANP